MNELDLKKDTVTIAGTTILGALVIIFDYTVKFSGLKIPFPWLSYLKFDFTGVPMVLSTLFFGLPSWSNNIRGGSLAINFQKGEGQSIIVFNINKPTR